MAIKAVVAFYFSKADKAGNVYWAFKYTELETKIDVCGKITGGESNLRSMLSFLHKDGESGCTNWEEIYMSGSYGFKIRDFEKMTKDWPHAGCEPRELAEFVKSKLK